MEISAGSLPILFSVIFCYMTQYEAEGCAMKPIPLKYRKPQPDPIYHYVYRKGIHVSVNDKALPGEACNYDHRQLKKDQKLDYTKVKDAHCVEESDPETSATCQYVYDREGFPIPVTDFEVQINGHPGDRWHKVKKAGDTFIKTKMYYKKCICPYKTPSGELVYHKTWDTTVDPPRPICTKEDHSKQPKGPGARGYTCLRADKEKQRESDKVVQEAIKNKI